MATDTDSKCVRVVTAVEIHGNILKVNYAQITFPEASQVVTDNPTWIRFDDVPNLTIRYGGLPGQKRSQ
jgi:hypothetical protein